MPQQYDYDMIVRSYKGLRRLTVDLTPALKFQISEV